jgi:EAL domain-containing protein (putative c-di-GMP-specific phosphodiesterase class I)
VRIIRNDEVVSPIQFLQTAKLSGMLPEITKIMIDKSFAVMKSNEFSFSINITEDDLDLDYLSQYLQEKSTEYGIAPKRVILEILEGMSSTGKRDHIRQLNAIKRMGNQLAIDDFGAEYSNFERVLDLEIDFLKIDARYIKDIDINNKSYEIAKSIVYFAKNAKIPCIAEFVHNENVQKIVEELGIEYSQGYLFSEPAELKF